MKIDFKSKNTKIVIIIIAVILIPILYNQGKSLITGLITSYQMSLPVEVQTQNPQKKEIYEEFETTGRIEAKYSINIIARVEGWLQKSYFKEGDTVKKGQKLFQIEPDEYALAARNAQARVSENSAVYKNSQIALRRAQALIKEDFVSQEYYDDAVAKRNEDRAALDGAIAQYNTARLNLSYTNVTAPFTGRVGKIEITEGNYVTAASGNLTTVYTTNPMRVTFALKSGDMIMLKKHLIASNKKSGEPPVIVKLKLADGTFYDKIGKIEFVDNKIDETTGTVTMRAEFENPHEILMPGDYVNVVLKLTQKTEVMTVPQSASKTDVGTGYYVWLVGKDGTTEKRDITVRDTVDNNWIVEKGLDYNDTVIVNGIQNIYHSGQKVKAVSIDETAKSETPKAKKSLWSRIKNKLKQILKRK